MYRSSWIIRCITFAALILPIMLMVIQSHSKSFLVFGQGIKGGDGSSSSFFQQTQQQQNNLPPLQQQQPPQRSQISSAFVEMFNSLTPSQQQQFISQMSSSNKRIIQKALLQQQPTLQQSSFNEESVSSSGGGSLPAGTKGSSSLFKSSQQSFSMSPVLPQVSQSSSFFKTQQQQQTKTSRLANQPRQQTQFSFSTTSNTNKEFIPEQQQPLITEFQSTRNTLSRPLPQQQAFFNQVREVKQVAQPVVVPSGETSFRRVQSFSSQPLPVAGPSSFNSNFVQQRISQQAIEPPQSTAFSRFQQSQFSSSGAPQPVPVNNQFSSQFSGTNSASSSLAGDGLTDVGDIGGFSGALQQQQQERLSAVTNTELQDNNFNNQQTITALGERQQQVEANSQFESTDAQQRNVQIPQGVEDFNGITAASINNKWYIMQPVDNPSLYGLVDAKNVAPGSLRQISTSRLVKKVKQIGPSGAAADKQSKPTSANANSNLSPTSAPSTAISNNNQLETSNNKKRSVSSSTSDKDSKKKVAVEESEETSDKAKDIERVNTSASGGHSSSPSLLELEDESEDE